MAGYSSTPLSKKLGIKPGDRVRLYHAPETLQETLAPLPEGATLSEDSTESPAVQLVFATERALLEHRLRDAMPSLPATGMIWLAWPKKASGVPTDLTRDIVRAIGLRAGLVDVKVCAIDTIWSGLKFVVRTADRPTWPSL